MAAEESLATDDLAPKGPSGIPTLRRPRLSDLLDLFTRPRWFFGGRLDLKSRAYILPAIFICGFAGFIDRLDSQLFKAQFSGTDHPLIQLLDLGWWVFWLVGSMIAVVLGHLIYWIGGWWYRVRIRLSGAASIEDPALPRVIYIWVSLVSSLPVVATTLAYTLFYPSYLAAYQDDELLSLLVLIFLFWSCAVSYLAVRENFQVIPWKAQIWFLYLPAILYLIVLGSVAALVSLFA